MARKASKKFATLPTGYKPIERGGFAASWDFRKQPLIEGVFNGFRTIEQGKGRQKREVKVTEIDGRTVWESAALRPLFDLKKGTRVAIAFTGFKKIPGRTQPMKLFEIGVQGNVRGGKRGKRAAA